LPYCKDSATTSRERSFDGDGAHQKGLFLASRRDSDIPAKISAIRRLVELRTEGEVQMIKPKRTAEQQLVDQADRKALNPVASRQTISDSQAEPEFQETTNVSKLIG
jgi:hypothetical protein